MLKFLKNIIPFATAAGSLLLAGSCSRTMYPQGQHRRNLQPPTDAVLCYGGSHHRTPFLWDKERLAPYVTYVDKEGGEHWLFDGFIFLEFQDTNRPDAELYAFETGHLRDKGESAGKAQWQELIDYYFTDGNGIEALEEAVKEAAARLGKAPQKRKVIMVLPDPVIHRHYIDTMSSTTYWGALDGRQLDFNRNEDRIAACNGISTGYGSGSPGAATNISSWRDSTGCARSSPGRWTHSTATT